MKRAFFVTLLPALAILLTPHLVHANIDDVVITNFQGDYSLTAGDPNGLLRTKEVIDVNFAGFNHGILRAIPNSYKGHSVHIQNVTVSKPTGQKWPYTTYTQNGNLVLKIGDANQTITGDQEFIVDYTVQNVVTFYGDHDELYWDINGDQWPQPFDKVSATFHIPSNYLSPDSRRACFAGTYGTDRADCTVQVNKDGTIKSFTNRKLQPYETLTTVISLRKGVFRPSTTLDLVRENTGLLITVFGLPVLAFLLGFIRWWRKGRDPKGRGTIVPEYDPPDGLRPALVGTIVDFKVDNRDISATIIDLAIRKYLQIIETDKKKLIGSSKAYSFKRINTDVSKLNDYEQELMKGLFDSTHVVDSTETNPVVELSSLKSSFYLTAAKIREKIDDSLKSDDYIAKNLFVVNKTGGLLLILLIAVSIYLDKAVVIPSLVLSAIILAVFQKFMSRRTTKGVVAREHILGLRLYMKTAEADRLEMLQSPNSPYAQHSKAPVKTVDLFEKLLPYAVALGVEQDWAKQFTDIYKEPPDWYSGNWRTFNAVYLVSSLGSSVSAMSTSFSPPSSSGSSGFSGGGGGFSGGGGGGGGGGAW